MIETPFSRLNREFIDRRLNPAGKNREPVRRALDRLQEGAKRAIVAQGIEQTKILGGNHDDLVVEIPTDDVFHEPTFHTVFSAGQRQIVQNGNKIYSTGDRIDRKTGQVQNGQGAGQPGPAQPAPQPASGGSGASADSNAGGQKMRVVVKREEFLKLYFADMKLPNLLDLPGESREKETHIAGHAREGAPHRRHDARTLYQSMGRRRAAGRASTPAFEAAQARLKELEAFGTPEELDLQRALVEEMEKKRKAVPWIHEVDLRYRRLEETPKPSKRAVMFHLMDVSGSMTHERKMIAKAFSLGVQLFLEKEYGKGVEHVFIRHDDKAERCTEEVYFGDGMTGGTKTSTVFIMTKEIADKEYPARSWNRFFAYAGDGDNSEAKDLIEGALVKLVDPKAGNFRYGAYLEVLPDKDAKTALAKNFEEVGGRFPGKLSVRRADDRNKAHLALRDMFSIKQPTPQAAFGPALVGAALAEP